MTVPDQVAVRNPNLVVNAGASSGDDGGPGRARGFNSGRQTIGAFVVPSGYEIWRDGVYLVTRNREAAESGDDGRSGQDLGTPTLAAVPSARRRQTLRRLTTKPIWIRSFGRVELTEEPLIEIVFDDPRGRTRVEWINFGQIARRMKLEELADRGAPIRTGNTDLLEQFFERAIATNSELPEIRVSTRTTALRTDAGWGWLIGRNWIGPEGTQVALDPRYRGDFGFNISGSRDDWLQVMQGLMQFGPVVRWLVHSTFAAPLMRPLDVRTFTIHHWNASGAGKSALAKFGASAWGNPARLFRHFNRTERSMIEAMYGFTDVPYYIDELQVSETAEIGRLVYTFSTESGRGRSGRTGGELPTIEDWRTLVRTTGEEPIAFEERHGMGGATRRLIQIGGYGIGEDVARDLHIWLNRENYGWAGPAFLTTMLPLVMNAAAVAQLASAHKEMSNRIAQAYPKIKPCTDNIAVVSLAQALFQSRIMGVEPTTAWNMAMEDAMFIAQIVASNERGFQTVVERALRIFRDHSVECPEQWLDLTDSNHVGIVASRRARQVAGYFADTEVWMVPSVAERLLLRNRLPVQRVWSDFQMRGILIRGDKRLTANRTFGSLVSDFIVLRRDAFFWPEPIN